LDTVGLVSVASVTRLVGSESDEVSRDTAASVWPDTVVVSESVLAEELMLLESVEVAVDVAEGVS
jgi:hypothetical protein